MERNKSKQARRAEEWAKQSQPEFSWKAVIAILGSISTLVGSIVSGLDFLNYLRGGYQQFLWLGALVLGIIWLIILRYLLKVRSIYGILWLAVTLIGTIVIWQGWRTYNLSRDEELIVLIANFDGPEEVYGLRNEIKEELNERFPEELDDGITIETLNEVITPDSDSGSQRAVKLGKNLRADVVIWGWYRPTENPNITIHLENLVPEELVPLESSTTIQPAATLAELESFSFQQKAGEEASALVSFLVGYLEFKSKNYAAAIGHFNQSLGYQGESLLLDNQWEIYTYRAGAYSATKRYDQALIDFDKVVELNPGDSVAYANRGSINATLGNYENAISDLKQAIEIDAANISAYQNLSLAYLNSGQHELALKTTNIVLELESRNKDSYFHRGMIYLLLTDYEKAVQDNSQVIDIDSEYFAAYGNRGLAYGYLGDTNRAIEDFDKALEINPQYLEGWVNRGYAYYSLGQYQRAIQDYIRALALAPQEAPIYYNRGLAYQKLGQSTEAEADFKKYEELTGEMP